MPFYCSLSCLFYERFGFFSIKNKASNTVNFLSWKHNFHNSFFWSQSNYILKRGNNFFFTRVAIESFNLSKRGSVKIWFINGNKTKYYRFSALTNAVQSNQIARFFTNGATS